MNMFSCKDEKRTVIGYLDDITRIVAADRFFVIERKSLKKDRWVGYHYYSEFRDLLRAYSRLLLRREEVNGKEMSRNVLQVLDRVMLLERKIDDTAKRLQEEWARVLADPIERAVLKGKHTS
jgi:hypothetical protein